MESVLVLLLANIRIDVPDMNVKQRYRPILLGTKQHDDTTVFHYLNIIECIFQNVINSDIQVFFNVP